MYLYGHVLFHCDVECKPQNKGCNAHLFSDIATSHTCLEEILVIKRATGLKKISSPVPVFRWASVNFTPCNSVCKLKVSSSLFHFFRILPGMVENWGSRQTRFRQAQVLQKDTRLLSPTWRKRGGTKTCRFVYFRPHPSCALTIEHV